MAGGLFSLAKLFGVTIRESATDGSDFTNPDADYRRLFLGEDGQLHVKDSAGTVTDIGGGSGNVATDAIWDAAGDLAVGSGANTAAKLVKGNAGGVLAMGNSAVIWNAGTSFPGSKATNDRYWRTDLAMEFFWDGTRWVTTTLYQLPITVDSNLSPFAASAGNGRMSHPGNALGLDVWFEDLHTTFYIAGGTALSGSHKWVGLFVKTDAANADTTVGTININSGSSSVWRKDTQVLDVAIATATYYEFNINWTKTGTPGNLYLSGNLSYRLIGT